MFLGDRFSPKIKKNQLLKVNTTLGKYCSGPLSCNKWPLGKNLGIQERFLPEDKQRSHFNKPI